MRLFRSLAAAAALVLAAAPPSQAQVVADPEAVLVEELVVRAAEPGPAWWRVRDGDSTVWILGIAGDDLPANVTWDQRALERRLKGANGLIVGTRMGLSAGLRDVPALLRARNQLKSKAPLEETLPPDLRARFVAARERLGQPAKRYAEWTPLIAGQRLVEDSRSKGQTVSVSQQILKRAKAHKVKARYPNNYEIMPFVRSAMASLTPQVHQQCLADALRDVEAPPGRAAVAMRGWADGNLPQALTEPRSFEKCLLLLGGGPELWRRAVKDQAQAIARALETPGHTVALISLRPLLAKDGVIEQLQARGLEVDGPGRE